MELITHHYSKSLRRAYERSISEQNYENHHRFSENIFLKGQNQNFLKERSYHHQEVNSLHDENLTAKDLTVNKSTELHKQQPVNGITSNRIKQEEKEEQMTSASIRRYFCIFCKMDFTNADHFLDHLELHQNGTFVLVKRDLISIPPQPLSPKIHLNNNNNNNISQTSSDRIVASVVEHNNNHIMIQERERERERERELAVIEEETSNLPIVPEELKNQIKIEPISEDEDEESLPPQNMVTNIPENHHISNRTSEHSSQHYNNDSNDGTNMHSSSPLNDNNSTETGDPNQQLMVLSNPRIGDGPGEYLCNVCHAKFVYKNNLKSHLKRHLGIYPYVCFCGKRYQFKCKLNKHIEQAHAKIKNFKCPVPTCPKKYFTRNDLAFHISVTHQERQEIPCNICQKVFNSQKSLQIHCRKYHRNQET
ncbi:myoneurin-like [Chironomus tepperi]|uniref:myoneurin-like n=1 Tax=Chironomus tepperi TaxID=113505 RepID=UPI00391FA886